MFINPNLVLPPTSLGCIYTYFISNSLYFFSDISNPNISLKVNSLLFGIVSFILESSFISYWYDIPFVFIVIKFI